MKLVVVSAGLSVPSSTRLLADRLAAATGRYTSVDVQVVELRDLAVEIAHNFTSGFPGRALSAALDAVTEADGLIVVTPVFSASYSGLFKSFFDVLDQEALTGKPVLIAATGGSARHSLVLEHALRPLFAYLRAVVVPTAVYAASEDWGAEGLAERIDRAAGELGRLMEGLGSGAGAVRRADAADTAVTADAAERADASVAVDTDTAAAIAPRALDGALASADRFTVIPFEQQLAALRP
ncbi:FMN reductase [Streptomyces mirabilis]|uniref:FMN reductase n=1 Tax=Streptomyces mirabilis TaxID=68239 RepID=UPI003717A6D6